MTLKDSFSAGFSTMIEKAGKPITIKYFQPTVGSVWDDEVTLTEITGSQITLSGIVMPVSTRYGSEDVNLVEQGKLRTQDQKLYVNGSIDFTGIGSNLNVKIILGTDAYTLIPIGGIPYEVENTQIYKKAYIRILNNGSLIGES